MNNDEILEVILDEQKFPYGNMTLQERNYYLNILRNCKDICDSNNRVDETGSCELVSLNLEKQNNIVRINGFLSLGTEGKRENRWIEASMYLEPSRIVVDMRITRIGVNCVHKVYTVLDEFTLENDNLKRRSQYNYDMKNLYDNIENEEMKGRLK